MKNFIIKFYLKRDFMKVFLKKIRFCCPKRLDNN